MREFDATMPILFSSQQRRFVQQQLEQFAQQVRDNEINPIFSALQCRETPRSLNTYLQAVDALQACFHQPGVGGASFELDEGFAPLLKAVLLARWRVVATDVDRRRAKTLHPEALAALAAEVTAVDEFATESCDQRATPLAVPRLAKDLTLA